LDACEFIRDYSGDISLRSAAQGLLEQRQISAVLLFMFHASNRFTTLTGARVRVSMDGRGRYLDNMLASPAYGSSNACGARSNMKQVCLQDIAEGFAALRIIDEWMHF